MSIRAAWRWLWSPRSYVQPPNERCPRCGAPVVVEELEYDSKRMAVQRPDAELIAACAEHGHSPFNEKTLSYLAQVQPPHDANA